jgi:hypothetical protein
VVLSRKNHQTIFNDIIISRDERHGRGSLLFGIHSFILKAFAIFAEVISTVNAVLNRSAKLQIL